MASQVSAFSALLRADVGQALGVSMKAVDLTGVSPAGETSVDWQEWTQWGVGALNVSSREERKSRRRGKGRAKERFVLVSLILSLCMQGSGTAPLCCRDSSARAEKQI